MAVKGCLIVFLSCWFLASNALIVKNGTAGVSFPDDFIFGVATGAYQIEGAWNEDGKGWSMWDYLVRTEPDHIADGSNGDIAANSYHLYKRDIEILKDLGVTAYRFSISWPRILPYGRNYVNQLGIDHYNNFINELLANGIEPYVTIYHWDLPQNLNELGGWLNEDIVDWFGDYARVLYQNFGDRVKHWFTINEPYIHCRMGYGYGLHAPRIKSPGVGYYECGRNILLAHARAYHIYDDDFREIQGGEVGIVLDMNWGHPLTDSIDDSEAILDYFASKLGQYMDPLFSENGNYPQRLIDRVAAASFSQGLSESRLRPFTAEQIEYMKGASDFLALNHYTSYYVYRNSSLEGKFEVPSLEDDMFLDYFGDDEWPQAESEWLKEYGPGLRHLLVYIKDTYNNPKIFITENGFSTTTGLVDDGRVRYFRNYWTAVLNAIDDGVDVRGYFAWSLLDNFEWSQGYIERFGICEVDMEDPDRPRTLRKSALVYKELIKTRVIDWEYNPDPHAYADNAYSISVSVTLLLSTFLMNLFYMIC